MSPEKYYQDLYDRLLDLTGVPDAKTLQRMMKKNDLSRELSKRGNKVSFRSRGETRFKLDS